MEMLNSCNSILVSIVVSKCVFFFPFFEMKVAFVEKLAVIFLPPILLIGTGLAKLYMAVYISYFLLVQIRVGKFLNSFYPCRRNLWNFCRYLFRENHLKRSLKSRRMFSWPKKNHHPCFLNSKH